MTGSPDVRCSGRRAGHRPWTKGAETDERDPNTASRRAARQARRRSGSSLARTLTVIGVLLVVVSALANYVKREALDEGRFKSTSRAIIADDAIRDQLALTLVDQLYSNTDVAASAEGEAAGEPPVSRCPDRRARPQRHRDRRQAAARAPADPGSVRQRSIAGTARVRRGAGRRYEAPRNDERQGRPRPQADHDQAGKPVRRPESQIPPQAGQITILESDQLKTGQRADQGAPLHGELDLGARDPGLGRRDPARQGAAAARGARDRDRVPVRRPPDPRRPRTERALLRRTISSSPTRSGRRRRTPSRSSPTCSRAPDGRP